MGKTLTIEERLQLHSLWLDGNPGGVRFIEHGDALTGEDLSGAYLVGADLSGARLTGAGLSGVCLRWADLRSTRFDGDVIRGADLRGADLSGATFLEVDIFGSDLRGACLRGACLSGADLRWARLDGADLRSADIRGANIDFSSWPLWCGSGGVIVDERIFRQLVDHLLAVVCDTDEARKAQEWLKDHVGRSHRAKDLGLIDG